MVELNYSSSRCHLEPGAANLYVEMPPGKLPCRSRFAHLPYRLLVTSPRRLVSSNLIHTIPSRRRLLNVPCDAYRWNWGSGQPSGTVKDVREEDTSIELKNGKEVRDGARPKFPMRPRR